MMTLLDFGPIELFEVTLPLDPLAVDCAWTSSRRMLSAKISNNISLQIFKIGNLSLRCNMFYNPLQVDSQLLVLKWVNKS